MYSVVVVGEERTAVAKSKKGINFRQYSRELPVAVTLVALVDDRRAAGGRGTRCYGMYSWCRPSASRIRS